jgi:tetratricopeptide (TPR) repeat protein
MKLLAPAAGLVLSACLLMANAAELEFPQPDLGPLEPEVAEHIRGSQQALASFLERPSEAAALADAHGSMARLYHAYELNEAAEYHYRQASANAPLDFAWHYYLGRLLQEQGRWDEASSAYADALALEPESALVLVRRGDVFLMQDRLEDAKANYLHAFFLHPRSNVLIERLGEVALGEKRYSLALEYLLPAVESQPDANRIHYFVGLAYRGLGDADLAREHLARSGQVGVEPPDPFMAEIKQMVRGERLYLLRGKLAYQAGQYQAAAEAFAKAVEAAPDSTRARVNLGSALAALKRNPEAIAEFRKALELDPEQPTAHFNLSQLLLEAGKPDEAIPSLIKAVEANPEDGVAQAALARVYRDTGDAEAALAHFRLAALNNPMDEDIWLDGAQLLLDLQRYPKALEILEQAHAKLPSSGHIAHALSQLLAAAPDPALRDGKRAVELASKVVQARPSSRHAQVLAMALAESGDCAAAADLQQQLLEALRKAQPDATDLLDSFDRQLQHYQAGPDCRPGITKVVQ